MDANRALEGVHFRSFDTKKQKCFGHTSLVLTSIVDA